MYIIIGLIMIVFGLFGLIKSKFPKYDGSAGYAALLRLYLAYIVSLVFGIALLISNIRDLIK